MDTMTEMVNKTSEIANVVPKAVGCFKSQKNAFVERAILLKGKTKIAVNEISVTHLCSEGRNFF